MLNTSTQAFFRYLHSGNANITFFFFFAHVGAGALRMRVTIKELELPFLSVLARQSHKSPRSQSSNHARDCRRLDSGFVRYISLYKPFFVVVLLIIKAVLLTEVLLLNFLCDKVCVWVRASCPWGL